MGRLQDKVAIITGGAAGIGLTTVRLFLEEGAVVVFTDVDAERGRSIEAELASDRAVFESHDVADEARWREIVGSAAQRFGGVDVLFNNAGIYRIASLAESTVAEWERMFAVNVTGSFLGLKHVLPEMARRGGGAVVNASSVAGIIGAPDHAAYGASKGAIRTLTKDAAAEYARWNVRVNSIHPGYIRTAMSDYASATTKLSVEELGRMYPLGRMGDPIEVARAVLFLASDEASFITGVELPIDGGFTAL
ncbi:SDR family NAD(P)-dependent oxidoreductase [Arthrobacter sulfonylureivorans]|uniref:Glucose 1-dehydrogenase n=1 Tax=Arthrobacter sulfonylureivorans TaxID=2486855 RepID=A0ABY3WJD1_9MICC|nr:glucose 1-dehydrogenase [Arthrobacter sulfonylureivorans]UNK47764.1 glucose 1-dehydrogenase [Arthrobacter sulfonylureivorans]